jgi:hypothetical protein
LPSRFPAGHPPNGSVSAPWQLLPRTGKDRSRAIAWLMQGAGGGEIQRKKGEGQLRLSASGPTP